MATRKLSVPPRNGVERQFCKNVGEDAVFTNAATVLFQPKKKKTYHGWDRDPLRSESFISVASDRCAIGLIRPILALFCPNRRHSTAGFPLDFSFALLLSWDHLLRLNMCARALRTLQQKDKENDVLVVKEEEAAAADPRSRQPAEGGGEEEEEAVTWC